MRIPSSFVALAVVAIAVVALAVVANAVGGSLALAQTSPLPSPLKWTSSPELVPAMSDDTHRNVAIKDPSIVRYEGKWHLFATTASDRGWQMVYLSFADWADAKTAKPFFMDVNPNLKGYHCAPQVFYFEPHKKWYLIYQSQHPQFSTTDNISDPMSWSKPQNFFAKPPQNAGKLMIDYWIICDDKAAYLFFTGDDGKVYRCQTALGDFPNGFGDATVVVNDPNRFNTFEGEAVYKIKGTNQYLVLIEAIGKGGVRFYRGLTANALDGEFKPLADTWDNPFAGMTNVTFPAGTEPWTNDISHGELIRDGYDQTLTIDPQHLQLLYQGRAPTTERIDYIKLPYRLGLLTHVGQTPTVTESKKEQLAP